MKKFHLTSGLILLTLLMIPPIAFAYSSSTNYKIYGGDINTVVGEEDSTNYQSDSGGQPYGGEISTATYNIQHGTMYGRDTGTVTITATGAYANGLHFNFSSGVEATKPAESDINNTPLNSSTDYLIVNSTLGPNTWEVTIASTSYTDGGTTYTPASAASATEVVLDAPASDQNSVDQYKNITNTTGTGCEPVNADVNLHQPTGITSTAQSVADIDNNDSHLDGCESYDTILLIPLDMDSITGGFPIGDWGGTITFTAAAE